MDGFALYATTEASGEEARTFLRNMSRWERRLDKLRAAHTCRHNESHPCRFCAESTENETRSA